MIDELMGHKIDKPKYGDGYGLRLKLKRIQAIAKVAAERRPSVKAVQRQLPVVSLSPRQRDKSNGNGRQRAKEPLLPATIVTGQPLAASQI